MRVNMAKLSPIVRAFFCSAGRSFPEMIAMNTMLSIPSTSSRTVKVNKPIQVSGSVSHSIGEMFVRLKSAVVTVELGKPELRGVAIKFHLIKQT